MLNLEFEKLLSAHEKAGNKLQRITRNWNNPILDEHGKRLSSVEIANIMSAGASYLELDNQLKTELALQQAVPSVLTREMMVRIHLR